MPSNLLAHHLHVLEQAGLDGKLLPGSKATAAAPTFS